MATGFEAALIKPVVDGLVALYKKATGRRLKSTAEQALSEAIRELLLAPSDLRSPEAKIAVAKAAGIINADLVLAEEMLVKSRGPAGGTRGGPSGPGWSAARGPSAKKAAAKKAPAKKAAAKKVTAKKPLAKKASTKKAPVKIVAAFTKVGAIARRAR